MKTFQLKVKILSQNRIRDSYWHCELDASQIAKIVLPGQFINIRVSDNSDPLLRRPISIHGVSAKKIKIFYEVVGKATEILARKKAGEFLDIIGPLGSGFSLKNGGAKIIVCGGMGVAPLFFLAERLIKQRTKDKIIVLVGARTKKSLLCVNDFKKLGCQVKTATDDGSSGFKGRVSDLLKHLLLEAKPQSATIYACGPKFMLKAVSEISKTHKIPAELSLEEHMSCGIGACLGCMVMTKNGQKRVCKEGPVFNARDLIW